MSQKLPPLNIKDPEVYRLAREISGRTGESMTEVVRKSLRDRLAKEKNCTPDPVVMQRLIAISDRCARRRVLDPRSDEEILGYDEHGVPG